MGRLPSVTNSEKRQKGDGTVPRNKPVPFFSRQNTRYEPYDIGMITHSIDEFTDPGVDETEE